MAVIPKPTKKFGTVYWVMNRVNGQPEYERIGTREREAKARDKEMQREIAKGTYVPKVSSRALTLETFEPIWGESRTNKNAKEERRMMRLYLRPRAWLTSKRLRDVTRLDTQRLVAELRAERKPGTDKRRLTDKTIANFLDALYQLFESAILHGYCSENPIKLPRNTLDRTPAAEREIYSPTEIIVLTRNESILWPVRVLSALCFYAGLRIGEAAGRKWTDIDGECPILPALVVRSQYDGLSLKTKQPRVIPIHPQLQALLAAWYQEGFRLYTGRDPQPGDFIVPQAGRRSKKAYWDRAVAYKAFVEGCKAVGIRPRTVHSARHTFISLCRRGGAREHDLTRITHNPKGKGKVIDRYTHADWEPLCAVVFCLRVDPHQHLHRPGVLSGDLTSTEKGRTPAFLGKGANSGNSSRGLSPGRTSRNGNSAALPGKRVNSEVNFGSRANASEARLLALAETDGGELFRAAVAETGARARSAALLARPLSKTRAPRVSRKAARRG